MSLTVEELENITKDKWYSATDIAKEYGKSRQYWEKVMKQGKIRYEQTSAGKITTQSWLDNYFEIKLL